MIGRQSQPTTPSPARKKSKVSEKVSLFFTIAVDFHGRGVRATPSGCDRRFKAANGARNNTNRVLRRGGGGGGGGGAGTYFCLWCRVPKHHIHSVGERCTPWAPPP